MAAPREVRIFLRHEGQDRKLAKVAFVKQGSNIYITPYGVDGANYYFGQQRMGRGQRTKEWDFTDQYRSAEPPHLSIHEDGRTHVRSDRDTAGSVSLPPLSDLRGEHLAAISCSRFEALPVRGEPLRTSGGRRDRVVPVPGGCPRRVSIYANALEDSFPDACRIRFKIETATGPLHVGLAVLWQDRLDHGAKEPALVVLSGWDPLAGGDVSKIARPIFIVAKV